MSGFSSQMVVVLLACILLGCTHTSNASDQTTVIQQTAGQEGRFTQFELDVAFRKQTREDVAALNRDDNLSVCCVLFYNDVKMLSKVVAHFKEHVFADVNEYGIAIQEDEKHYIISFSERYRESMQYLAGDYWEPGISDPGLKLYSYLVDRKSLEILEFIEVPS